jgi:Nucleotidyl transferase AbiEii toxin, Type IV TA system
MTRDKVRNVPASVLARLLTLAKETGDDYQTLLLAYAAERFLFRLGASDLRERFVLKGAMVLRIWSDHPYRATRDLDLLRRGDGSAHRSGATSKRSVRQQSSRMVCDSIPSRSISSRSGQIFRRGICRRPASPRLDQVP